MGEIDLERSFVVLNNKEYLKIQWIGDWIGGYLLKCDGLTLVLDKEYKPLGTNILSAVLHEKLPETIEETNNARNNL